MRYGQLYWIGVLILFGFLGGPTACKSISKSPTSLSSNDQKQIERGQKELGDKLAVLRSRTAAVPPTVTPDHWADVDIFYKGVVWALQSKAAIKGEDVALIKKALKRGQQRAELLAVGKYPWALKKGRLVRGYLSAVDGSTQPYRLVIPPHYDSRRPMRLDVVLHGSMGPDDLAELHFMAPFDQGDEGGDAPSGPDYIELHPLGRVENCYRWAGETDV